LSNALRVVLPRRGVTRDRKNFAEPEVKIMPESNVVEPPSRHQRFRAIMDAAAGTSTATYSNHPRFWNLPLPELRNFELYGIAMMRPGSARPAAPAAAPSCCHGEDHCHAAAPASGGAAEAGLVRGLRGQFPFDGTQFPPLPWGGKRVAEADIVFIAQWIADGCPGADEDHSRVQAAHVSEMSTALAAGHAPHPLFEGPTNQLADESGSVKARKNVEHLPDEELRRLRAAIAQMKSLDAYPQDERSFAYWARIHANQCQHGWEQFLTWHRAYLYGFEKRLQDIDPTVTLPYWDWASDSQNVKASLDDMGAANNDNGFVPAAYQCWVDEDGLRKLTDGGKVPQAVLAGLRAKLGKSYSSGARLFKDAGIQYSADPASDEAIKKVLGDINPLFDWKRWPGGNASLIFEAYPTPDDVERILGIDDFFDFGSGSRGNQFFGSLETVHNLIHNFSGGNNPYSDVAPNEIPTGDMVDPGTTAFDPIFWGHHSNCDRLWSEWQRRHPGGGPDDPGDPLPPWNLSVDDTYSISRLGYEYMMASKSFLTNSAVPIQRFQSVASAVHPKVIALHGRAEIRLHAVQYVARPGFHIRAFLNTPDASVATPTRGNPNYVGLASMFTGVCIGGPGHCDVPAPRTDPFDLRPRPHKTPSNIRFDATDAVKRLASQGATSFAVNLVVLNTDGTPAADALKIDAVSLNFFDRPSTSNQR
jgi:tyrosinase